MQQGKLQHALPSSSSRPQATTGLVRVRKFTFAAELACSRAPVRRDHAEEAGGHFLHHPGVWKGRGSRESGARACQGGSTGGWLALAQHPRRQDAPPKLRLTKHKAGRPQTRDQKLPNLNPSSASGFSLHSRRVPGHTRKTKRPCCPRPRAMTCGFEAGKAPWAEEQPTALKTGPGQSWA